jgi:hypothetical protein
MWERKETALRLRTKSEKSEMVSEVFQNNISTYLPYPHENVFSMHGF